MSTVVQRPSTDTTTIVTRVRDRAVATPDAVAMRRKDLGIWRDVTWRQYHEQLVDVAHALLALGIEPGDRVAIHAENRPEWLVTDLATVAVRAITVGLYPTNPAAEVRHILADSGARVLIAEDQEQVDKALEVIDDLPALEVIVYLEPRGLTRYTDPRLRPWSALVATGREHRAAHEGAVEERARAATPEDVMTLVYTSGTTGPPKGAMLTVANAEFAIERLIQRGGFVDPPPNPSDVLLSYLPLCHIAERIFTVWFNAAGGAQVAFAESIDTVQQNLREIQPSILFGVPRIWEKMLAGVQIRIASASRVKRAVGHFWLGVAGRIGDALVASGGAPTTTTRLLGVAGDLFLFRALRDRLGLRKVRYAVSGAAPVSPEVLKFFMGIGVPMHEAYGQTENTAVCSSNPPGRIKLGTVGVPYDGIDVRLDPETGEIQTRHAGNFAGYWNRSDASAEAMTDDGFLRTGDVGEWIDGTHLKITDRLKDIIITAGGKNVSPSEIENELKTSPYVKEAIVVGDGRSYLAALIGIELDTVGEWAQRRKLAYTTYRDLSEKPEVLQLVQDVVDAANEKFSRVEGIKTFRMLPKELDHEDGELTATQKVKRAAIAQQYGDVIESMYPSAA